MHIKFENQTDINFNVTSKIFNWFECEKCGMLAISPLFNETEELNKYYSNYQPHAGGLHIARSLSFVDKISINIRAIQKTHDVNSTMKIIDLGCGKGDMLVNISNHFPNAELYGLDYNISPVKENLTGYPVTLFEGGLDVVDSSYKFDYILSSQLLEHLERPQDYIDFIKEHSHTETIILTDIPNLDSRTYKAYQDKWVHLDTPRHRNHFSKKSLHILFNEYTLTNFREFGTNHAFITSFCLKHSLKTNDKRFIIRFRNYILNKLINVFVEPDDKIHFLATKNIK